ncbi:DUF2169 domain-containing protein [Pantoea sp. Acro-805]|uniref:DUF2169 domain-containing protein n=1 Tax=Candidatus Pantoea formicae TaxID=2608355 RepID=A0ABX0QYV9_9GAMM|nr:DUF2169 domain-containing protein [Pantoea formicae]NIF00311.1 DUF2169 domain-containing protein [Pantoea formicae]
MQIIKPSQLNHLSRPYRWQGQDYLGVAVMALLDMSDTPILLDEQTLWQRVNEELQLPDGVLDLAIPKHCAEFLASGFGFPQAGNLDCDVSIQVGSLRKQQRLAHENPVSALPATFHPIAINDPLRQAFMGHQYDDQWLQHDYPGFARDTDWRAFNQAPADQWWEDNDRLPRGAAWRIENMHPQHLVQQGHLPLWQARAFITRNRHNDLLFEEVNLRATTVHFLPHCNELILIWHGCCAINEDDAFDVHSLMLALELDDKPRDQPHYAGVHHRRSNDDDAALHALRDKDLIDPAILSSVSTAAPEPEPGPLVENLRRYEQQQRQQFDPHMMAHHSPSMPKASAMAFKPEEDLATQFQRHEIEGEKQYQQMMATYQREQQRNPTSPMHDGATQFKQQREVLQAQFQRQNTTPEQQKHSEEALWDSYRLAAQNHIAAPRLSLAASEIQRQQLLQCMAGDKNARGRDFTGADLSGLDLRGIDFENALLENTDLSHCRLDYADLRGAVLVRAELHHTSLTHCLFDGANLSLTQCWHSDFSDSSFEEIELEGIELEHCRFHRALLSQLLIQRATLANCDFQHAQLEYCDLMDLKLENLDFGHVQLSHCSFIRCQLDAVNFHQVSAQSLSLVSCTAERLCFDEAELKQCLFTAESRLRQARFRRATLLECNLRDIDMQSACFDEATLENSDLSGTDCRDASLQLLRTRLCRFVRTDFRAARLTGSLLLGADLQKSQLQGCDISDCNLFRADLSQSQTDEATRFDHALTDSMKTLPHRREHQV